MGARIEELRRNLARALDDNLHTRQWHNVVDWLIVGMILLSTTEIFLSTFDISPRLRRVLWWVDLGTLIFFTIEVSLRIWVAPEINPAFKGWKGRLKYCFTFWGGLDILATFPFYLQWIFPLPVAAFKMLRTARVVRALRIGRYSKSFSLLSDAIREKRRELIVSMQFLVVITLILSLVLFFAEHEAQPDVYKNGFISVVWAFAQYIGDPGQFADTPPITGVGRIIACIVGLLGIAIVAVPAGIIGAGFTESLEREAHKTARAENTKKVQSAFQRRLDRPTGYQVVPPLISMVQLQARTGLKTDEIVETVHSDEAPFFRLVNVASTIPADRQPTDQLAIEHFVVNRPYGLCIDRKSHVTIISPSSYIEAGSGSFAFYLALIGGFNYISRELGDRTATRSYHVATQAIESDDAFRAYLSDLESLLSRPGSWSITVLVASGALEPEFPTQLHFGIGGEKGEEFDIEAPLVGDVEKYKEIFDAVARRAKDEFSLESDHQRYHSSANSRLVVRRFPTGHHIVLRIEWYSLLWDSRRMELCRMLAEVLSRTIEGRDLPVNPELARKTVGFEGYDIG